MTIEAFIITWNREDIIHLTINHYKAFCSKIVIFDNFSTDRTREIAEATGCEVKLFGKAGILDDGEYVKVKNNCWKGSKADWVIVCDDDEILTGYEDLSTEFTAAKTQGYEMYSYNVPRETFLEVSTGIRNDNYSKLVCFNPSKIKGINYVYGCHQAKPIGEVVLSKTIFKLLHYRSIGGPDRLIKRHREYVSRLSPLNQKWNLGHHYKQSEEEKRREWIDSYEKSSILF